MFTKFLDRKIKESILNPFVWKADDEDRRKYFGQEFKKVKDYFDLGTEYILYSFRHTFITKVYRKYRETMSPDEAKGKLMLITGHTNKEILSTYLRDIGTELPEDYSH